MKSDEVMDVAPPSLLWELCIARSWEGALERARSHPKEATVVAEDGRTALHAMFCGNERTHLLPATLVGAICRAYPEAASMKSAWSGPGSDGCPIGTGNTPIHLAAANRYSSWDSWRELLDASHDALWVVDDEGDTPLHVSCKNWDFGHGARDLVAANPLSALVENKAGLTPLQLASEHSMWIYGDDQKYFGDDRVKAHLQESSLTSESCETPVESVLKTIGCLLKAEYHGTVSDALPKNISWRVVHACFGIKNCPARIIHVAVDLCRDQMQHSDECGNYPLQLAAQNRRINGMRLWVSTPIYKHELQFNQGDIKYGSSGGVEILSVGSSVGQEDMEYGSDSGVEILSVDSSVGQDDIEIESLSDGPSVGQEDIEYGSDSEIESLYDGPNDDDKEAIDSWFIKSTDLVTRLTDLYPDAATRRNRDGDFPLHLAIKSGKTWHSGIGSIANAAPDTVAEQDKDTRLYPFMLAAVGNQSCLSTVYKLLVRRPELGGVLP